MTQPAKNPWIHPLSTGWLQFVDKPAVQAAIQAALRDEAQEAASIQQDNVYDGVREHVPRVAPSTDSGWRTHGSWRVRVLTGPAALTAMARRERAELLVLRDELQAELAAVRDGVV